MNSTPITNYNQINISNSEQTRVIAEIQAMVFLAKNDPRDENLVLEKVVKQCQRKSMAEVAMYSFPRGGQNVTGPSIRLAEVLGRAYGNIEFGVKILSQNENSVSALAYCWDLETNVRKTDYFEVRLEKYTKKDGNKKLTDPRDIYEHVASQGSRRVRGCILAMIPGDIVELAMDYCEKTLQSNTESLPERIQKLISAFTSYNITTQMLELRIGKNINAINNTELVSLRKIYQSIKDGMSNSSDYFDFTKHSQSKTTPIVDIAAEDQYISEEQIDVILELLKQQNKITPNQVLEIYKVETFKEIPLNKFDIICKTIQEKIDDTNKAEIEKTNNQPQTLMI